MFTNYFIFLESVKIIAMVKEHAKMEFVFVNQDIWERRVIKNIVLMIADQMVIV
jgi:hypothetical protein